MERLGIRTQGGPGPHITTAKLAFQCFRNVLFLGVTETPNFIALDSFTGKVSEHFILILGACVAQINQEVGHRVLGNTSHPDRCTDTSTFH